MNNVIGIALDEFYRIFEILNRKYYDGKLPEPVLTIQKGRSNNLGWFILNKVWKNKSDEQSAKYEINITAGNLNRNIVDIVGTLHHEMVHYMNKISEIKDCSGQRHNKKFKDMAERVGLICEKSNTYGWGFTECSDDLKTFILDVVNPNTEVFDYFRQENGLKSPKKPVRKNLFKYVCPKCNMKVKAEEDKNIVCGDCSIELISCN